VTGFHIDWGDNILAQLQGRKELHLASPEQSRFMYIGRKFDQGTTLSEVDLDNPDLQRFPLFEKAELIKIILHPGEMIFIPRGWWHHVRSLDASISVSNLALDLKGILFDTVPQKINCTMSVCTILSAPVIRFATDDVSARKVA